MENKKIVLATLIHIISVIAIILIPAGSAFAHKVSVFAYSDRNTVHVEGYFADGTGCKNCAVTAYDKGTGQKLAEGRTDQEGMFSFPAPSAGTMGTLKIVLDAGLGHGGEFLLKLGEGTQAAPAPAPEGPAGLAAGGGSGQFPALPDKLDEALDRKLAPLVAEVRRLRKAQERPGITEILGGIGYIVGLAGLAAYLAYRKKGKG